MLLIHSEMQQRFEREAKARTEQMSDVGHAARRAVEDVPEEAKQNIAGGAYYEAIALTLTAFEGLASPVPLVPIATGQPAHVKYRRVLDPMLAPRVVNAMEDELRAQARELVRAFAGKGTCDVVADLGRLYPTQVFLTLFGMPVADRDQFIEWSETIIENTSSGTDHCGLIAERNREPDRMTQGPPKKSITARVVRPLASLVDLQTRSAHDTNPAFIAKSPIGALRTALRPLPSGEPGPIRC